MHLNIDAIGLGSILKNHKLAVPLYQRSYAWKRSHVSQLLYDLNRAISEGKKGSKYFLGSVVVIKKDDTQRHEIVDGQQRLATISILIAAIRDYCLSIDDDEVAREYERTYLRWLEVSTRDWIPRLKLNEDDNQCYEESILESPQERTDWKQWQEVSHKRLRDAYSYVSEYVEKLVATEEKADGVQKLHKWVEYITNQAQVVYVEVTDEADAYRIFESLNDRGLNLTIADLVKNFMFGLAGSELDSVRANWSQMKGALGTIAGRRDRQIDYIRQLWCSMHGMVRSGELFSSIREEITRKKQAVELSREMAESAKVYAGIFNTSLDVWDAYGSPARKSLEAIRVLRVERVRPLILSIVKCFDVKEGSKALKFLEAACVRILVANAPAGTVEQELFEAALLVRKQNIRKTSALRKALKSVPNDSTFETQFKTLRVGVSRLARYYLQSLENTLSGDYDDNPVTPDETKVTLEHILPAKNRSNWTHVPADKADDLCRRLGNLVLLSKKANNSLGAAGPNEKLQALKEAENYRLTAEIPEKWSTWGENEIRARQDELAALALRTWPLQ